MKRRYSWPLWTFAGIIVLLIALHIALPYVVRDYLNEKLADMGDYRGQITDVDLAWWRGAYKINGAYAPKASPGPHKLRDCMPLIVFIRNR